MRLLQADDRNRELENQLRSAERTREELLSLQGRVKGLEFRVGGRA